MTIPKRCPLCSKNEKKQVVVTQHVYGYDGAERYAFYHCQVCDVRYLFPRLTDEQEKRFYVNEFEKFMAGRAGKDAGWDRPEDHIKANEGTRLRRMKYLNSYIKKSKTILEVGCSSGFMLFPLVKQKKNCVGVEPSGVFKNYLTKMGLKVFDTIEDISNDKDKKQDKYDLIMHFFVLEHISDPLNFLQKQINLLNPGGNIVFEIPNANDPLYSIYDIPSFERFYWSIAHPWYFSEMSLKYLMEKLNCNFKIIREQRYDLSNHMVWARDGKPGGMGRYSAKLGKKIEEEYKQALIASGRCDTLVGIINKAM